MCVGLGIKEKGKCPIPQTHSRLLEAHIHWHDVVENYHNPAMFNMYLNTCIQSLRNITFIMQSEKKNIPNFDEWYQRKQAEMRLDIYMKWLNDARTEVVKRGDLEKESVALVSFRNWLDYPLGEMSIPPCIPVEDCAALIGGTFKELPKGMGDVVLCVERRWVISELPEYDVVEILARGFGYLNRLIMDAHFQCGINITNNKLDVYGRPKCMASFKNERFAHYSITNNAVIRVEFEPSKDPMVPISKVIEHYGKENIPINNDNSGDIYRHAESMMEMGKVILKKDKQHGGIVFIYVPDAPIVVCQCNPPDRDTKYIMYREIASIVEQKGASGVIFISEVWLLDMDEYDGSRISESEHRKEGLAVHVLTKNGPFREYMTPFSRDENGEIVIGETRVSEDGTTYFIKPIYDVWKRDIHGT